AAARGGSEQRIGGHAGGGDRTLVRHTVDGAVDLLHRVLRFDEEAVVVDQTAKSAFAAIQFGRELAQVLRSDADVFTHGVVVDQRAERALAAFHLSDHALGVAHEGAGGFGGEFDLFDRGEQLVVAAVVGQQFAQGAFAVAQAGGDHFEVFGDGADLAAV